MTQIADNTTNSIARFNMIEQQIRTWEVLDPKVLQLLNEVPRENFVPAIYQGLAFADIEIPLGASEHASGQKEPGQNMLSPKLEARILQSLNVKKSHEVLHIGTGSGYFAALLAAQAKHVNSLEIDAELSATAAYKLSQNNIHNVTLELADGIAGMPYKKPFDVIVFTGSSPVEPAGVRQQLNVGGLMFIVLGQAPVMQATLIQRISEDAFKVDVLFETCIATLENAPQVNAFEF
ncbi:MAG: protein-L-isoaspartate O-methyltransferase family protein [Methylophilaceae bacterium]